MFQDGAGIENREDGLFISLVDQLGLTIADAEKARFVEFQPCRPKSSADRISRFSETECYWDLAEAARRLKRLALAVQLFIDDLDSSADGAGKTGSHHVRAVLARLLNLHPDAVNHPDFIYVIGLLPKEAQMSQVASAIYQAFPSGGVHLIHGGLKKVSSFMCGLCPFALILRPALLGLAKSHIAQLRLDTPMRFLSTRPC